MIIYSTKQQQEPKQPFKSLLDGIPTSKETFVFEAEYTIDTPTITEAPKMMYLPSEEEIAMNQPASFITPIFKPGDNGIIDRVTTYKKTVEDNLKVLMETQEEHSRSHLHTRIAYLQKEYQHCERMLSALTV